MRVCPGLGAAKGRSWTRCFRVSLAFPQGAQDLVCQKLLQALEAEARTLCFTKLMKAKVLRTPKHEQVKTQKSCILKPSKPANLGRRPRTSDTAKAAGPPSLLFARSCVRGFGGVSLFPVDKPIHQHHVTHVQQRAPKCTFKCIHAAFVLDQLQCF